MTATEFTEVAGYVGAALAGAAYVPQIWHLVAERCAAGLSRVAFGVWLTSSMLVTAHAVTTSDTVFIALGITQIAAVTVILAFSTRYAHSRCASHRQPGLPASGSGPSNATTEEQTA